MASLHDYQESLGESTSTSATPATKVSSSTTLTSGIRYLIIWSCQIRNDSTAGSGEVRLTDVTGSSDLTVDFAPVTTDTTNYSLVSGAYIYTAGATATREFAVRHSQDATGTMGIKNARLLILALDASDFASSSTGSSTTTSTSFQDKVSLSVNGATAGDYLFVGSLVYNDTDASDIVEIQGLKTDGSTAVNVAKANHGSGALNQPYCVIWRETLDGSNVSAKLQYRSTDGGSRSVNNAHLAAIRIASLGAGHAFTLDDADDAGTDTVATDSETLQGDGVDTVSGDVIVIAAVTYMGNDSTISAQVDFREASTTIVESVHEPASATVNLVNGIVGYVSSSANDPETWKWRRLSETSSATTTVNYAAIAVLGLQGGATDYDGAANDGSIVIGGKVATLQADQNLTAAKGAITINGQAATITADTGYQETATKGALTITGQGATLVLDQNLSANDGAIVINGQGAVIELGEDAIVTATAGTITVNGQPATISTDCIVTATCGQIVINGHAPVLVVDANLAANAGAIAISGKAATITISADALLDAGSRRMSILGQPAHLYVENNGGTIVVIPNSIDGPPARQWYDMVLEADRDYEATNDRPVIYRFGKPEPKDRRFERQHPEYEEYSE